MSILKTIFDICLLRGRPQDLPASTNLLQLTILATVVTGYARVVRVDGPGIWGLILVVFQTAVFGAVVWLILQVRARTERWLQSILALYAVNTLFNLIILPILPQLVLAGKVALEAIQQGAATPIGWELIFASAADIWYLMVMAQVMRHATDLPFGLSAFISFTALMSVFVLEMLFISVFSVPVTA